MNQWQKQIKDLFPKVINSLSANDGRLAYLSLTSKPEGPIRDEFAWLLQKEFDKNNEYLISAREYSRYDLAILEVYQDSDNKEVKEIKHVFEFKVGSAANFRGGLAAANKFVDGVKSDLKRGIDANPPIYSNEITSIFIAPEALQKVKGNQRPFIKYAARHNGLRKLEEKKGDEKYIGTKIKDKFNDDEELVVICQMDAKSQSSFKNLDVRLHFYMIESSSN